MAEHDPRGMQRELRQLRDNLLGMAGRVEQMIARASRALFERDIEIAAQVVKEDDLVNQAELDIDDLCSRLLERHRPTGADLRFVTRALKMVTDLERIGDLAVNLAERTAQLTETSHVPVHSALERMSQVSRTMVSNAIDAFVNHDVEAAAAVIAEDDIVDDLHARVKADVEAMMATQPENAAGYMQIFSASSSVERIADHATNLAEQVVFMVRGDDVRHEKANRRQL